MEPLRVRRTVRVPGWLPGLVLVVVGSAGCVDLTPPWQNPRGVTGGASGGFAGQSLPPDGYGAGGSGGTSGPESDALALDATVSLDAPQGSGNAGGDASLTPPPSDTGWPVDGARSALDGSEVPLALDLAGVGGGTGGARTGTGGARSDGAADSPLGGSGGGSGTSSDAATVLGSGGANPGTGGSGVGGSGGAVSVDGGGCGSKGVLDSGICWYMGGSGESCATACTSHGGTSSEAPGHIGTAAQGGSLDECKRLLRLLGRSGTLRSTSHSRGEGTGCYLQAGDSSQYLWLTSPAYSDSASARDAQLVCGCLR